MIERGIATDNDMVLAFLKAEIDSPSFGGRYNEFLNDHTLTRRSLVDQANLWNMADNLKRKALLNFTRGYTAGKALFDGFLLTSVGVVPTSSLPKLKD